MFPRLLFSLLLICFIVPVASAQSGSKSFDKALADSLGADAYGMKLYVLVILKTGPNNTKDTEKVKELFRGHMDNIGRLAANGKLIVAGPLQQNDKNYRGIFILDVKTLDEAKALLQTDPAVVEKLLAADFYNWYGSAALPMYLPIHDKIEQKKP